MGISLLPPSSPKPIRILLTSVGSLVGQNILDVLDYAPFHRRGLVELVGTNSIAANANIFRCDRCYLTPETARPEFEAALLNIIEKEAPDLAFCGRDEDTVAVADLLRRHPGVAMRIPHGSPQSLLIALDKSETWEFCKKHRLPCAMTHIPWKDSGGLEGFATRVGYPLIAKPVRGFASKGVFFVRTHAEAKAVNALGNYIYQEYLGDPAPLTPYFQALQTAAPLFAHAPNVHHHSCHTFIHPSGELDQIFISRNVHSAGVTVGFERVFDDALDDAATQFA